MGKQAAKNTGSGSAGNQRGKKRLGRPPHPDGLYQIIAFNCRAKMKHDLERLSKRSGKSISAVIREMVKPALERAK